MNRPAIVDRQQILLIRLEQAKALGDARWYHELREEFEMLAEAVRREDRQAVVFEDSGF